jgi:2-keto-4-pentenoate hydratase/2-oxohepta-3-ene-1,7-dioic acid hydratase in catechol pathway
MRLVSYATNAKPCVIRSGVELGDEILDLALLFDRKELSMRQFLELGEEGLSTVRAAMSSPSGHFCIAKSQFTMKAPIYGPEKVLCVGMNYVDHCVEQGFPIPTEPIIFNKFPGSIIASGEPISHSNLTEELDFEVELVIVIGKEGRHISTEDAMSHVAGYTVAHDVSARDWQLKKNGGQWLLGKTFDTYSPIGPAIVTTDELKDPHSIGIRCFLNGEQVQNGNTDQLIFKTDFLIHWISSFVTLRPGDLILTGTPPGVGCFRKPPLFLKAGDSVTCEIDGIGSITNVVERDPITARL